MVLVAQAKKDDHKECEFWANSGECTANPNYMKKSCAASCDSVKHSNGIKAKFTVGQVDEFLSVTREWNVDRDSASNSAEKTI